MTGSPEAIGQILFPAEAIQERVRALGQAISADYAGKDVLLVTVLRGGIFFLVDLVRAISIPVAIDLMAISSYGPGAEKQGVVRILKDLEEPIGGRHVLVVEDVIDTGLTLSSLSSKTAGQLTAIDGADERSLFVTALANSSSLSLVEWGTPLAA